MLADCKQKILIRMLAARNMMNPEFWTRFSVQEKENWLKPVLKTNKPRKQKNTTEKEVTPTNHARAIICL